MIYKKHLNRCFFMSIDKKTMMEILLLLADKDCLDKVVVLKPGKENGRSKKPENNGETSSRT